MCGDSVLLPAAAAIEDVMPAPTRQRRQIADHPSPPGRCCVIPGSTLPCAHMDGSPARPVKSGETRLVHGRRRANFGNPEVVPGRLGKQLN